jgi:hypothetical protein
VVDFIGPVPVAATGVGHCPQDEAPHKVNPLIAAFTRKYGAAAGSTASSEAAGTADAVYN